jgi:hypothetical protein
LAGRLAGRLACAAGCGASFAGTPVVCSARFRAAVIAAGGLLGGGWRCGWCSAGRGGERVELLERGLERFGPRPRCGEVQLGLAA